MKRTYLNFTKLKQLKLCNSQMKWNIQIISTMKWNMQIISIINSFIINSSNNNLTFLSANETMDTKFKVQKNLVI